MIAQIYQIRDYQPKRKEEKLKRDAAKILSQVVAPKDGSGIDGMKFEAPPEDCA